MSAFDCQVDIPKSSSEQKDVPLTVGKEFFVICKGDWPRDLKVESLRLELPEAQKYALKLLNFNLRDLRTADLKVVSYRTGLQKIEKLTLTDGVHPLELSSVEFQVQSVLDPGKQKNEPFGPIGPLSLSWPPIYWILIIGVSTMVLSLAGFKIYGKLKRKKWLLEIRKYDNVHSPLSQLHSEFRRLQRKFTFFGATSNEVFPVASEEMTETLKIITQQIGIFLIRELQINALAESPKRILAELRRHHPQIYKEQHEALRKWQNEMKKLNAVQGTIRAQDLRQIVRESRELAESIHESMLKTKPSSQNESGGLL